MYFFRAPLLFCFVFFFHLDLFAQRLKFLIPDQAIVQYAGSIGYVSAGISYEVFKNNRGNIDLLYGFVPGNKGGVLHIATAKFSYKPWQLGIKDWGKFYPFNPGAFVSYTFHKDLSFKFPSGQYAHDYYYWSEAIRPHLSFNTEIELNMSKISPKTGIKALGIYLETNTNDYYLINFLQNTSALTINDIFQLGIGMRVKF